ncbi:MAG: hypothetical protein A2X49_07690 [Lentisphaerae bacterium GWF2_52_8]|nr:MAG: hypothetical protein A2X49_07690 [Lentisphaerae bacterium GWF2_52_8]
MGKEEEFGIGIQKNPSLCKNGLKKSLASGLGDRAAQLVICGLVDKLRQISAVLVRRAHCIALLDALAGLPLVDDLAAIFLGDVHGLTLLDVVEFHPSALPVWLLVWHNLVLNSPIYHISKSISNLQYNILTRNAKTQYYNMHHP